MYELLDQMPRLFNQFLRWDEKKNYRYMRVVSAVFMLAAILSVIWLIAIIALDLAPPALAYQTPHGTLRFVVSVLWDYVTLYVSVGLFINALKHYLYLRSIARNTPRPTPPRGANVLYLHPKTPKS